MNIEKDYAIFGELIRSYRERKGLSQADLAEKFGVTRVSISNIEAGRQRVLFHQALQFARELDFSISEVEASVIKARLEESLLEKPSVVQNAVREIRGALESNA